MRFSRVLASLLLLWTASSARGEVFVQKALLQLGAAYHYTYSLPDRVAGATYEKKFLHGFLGHGRVGTVLSPGVYLGASFNYWSATRKLTDESAVETTDVLNYQTLGVEVGAYVDTSPRTYFMLIGGVYTPLKMDVLSTSGGTTRTFTGPKLYGTELRAAVGVKLFPRVALIIEGGFHWANLRYLESSGTPYVGAGDVFDLSGAKMAAFLGIHI